MRKFQNHFLGRLSVILAACKQSILGYVFVDCYPTSSRHCEAKNSSSNSGVASYGATIQVLCSLQDKLMQKSTTHSSFDQYCISHKTIGYRAAAAPGPEVRRECPMTFPALPLLATKLLATPLGSKACWDTVVSCCELSEQIERMNSLTVRADCAVRVKVVFDNILSSDESSDGVTFVHRTTQHRNLASIFAWLSFLNEATCRYQSMVS